MVDLSKATASQKERFLKLMDTYCANNTVDPSIFPDADSKQRCYSIQIEALKNKIDTVPDKALSYFYLANLYRTKNMLDEAVASYFKSLQIKPHNARVHYGLAYCLHMQGNIEQAIEQYRNVLRLRPNWSEALDALAWILATVQDPKYRDGAQAVRLAEKACKRTDYENPLFLDTLAAAYAETNQFTKAKQTAQRAINLALSAGNTELARFLDTHRQLYKAGKKFQAGPHTTP
jgi:cytochrome c-type biogenesis protein CcmH/NrfG